MSHSLQVSRTIVASVALWALTLGSAAAAPTLSITGVVPQTVGSNFTLDVSGSSFADLYAYQFDLTFDPSMFRANSAGEGAFLLNGGTTFFNNGTIDNSNGTVSMVFDSLLGDIAGVSGSGVLAYFNFSRTALTSGATTFGLANVTALDSSLADIGVSVESLSVSAVPEPGAWAMLMAGVGLIGAIARRRKASALSSQ